MSIDICKELSQNFIDFAYEANSQRAFPDARHLRKHTDFVIVKEKIIKEKSEKKVLKKKR